MRVDETRGRGHPAPAPLPGVTEPHRLRAVLAHVPTSVTVVTTLDGPRPVGATIGSFGSVSLDPPLVAYFAIRGSATLAAVRRHGAFIVNVLADGDADLARVFAGRSADRFHGVPWRLGAGGCPQLDAAIVVVGCDVHQVLAVGDHDMVVGRVTSTDVQHPGLGPLVRAAGAYQRLARVPASRLHEVAEPA